MSESSTFGNLFLPRTMHVSSDVMSSSVVAAEEDKTREDLEEIFTKYRYRMLPVVDTQDHLLGAIRYSDLMQPEHEKT